MQTEQLRGIVEDAWEARDSISPKMEGAVRDAVTAALAGFDTGDYRAAAKAPEGSQVHQGLKKEVLQVFRFSAHVGAEAGMERGWQYVLVSVWAVSLNRNSNKRQLVIEYTS